MEYVPTFHARTNGGHLVDVIAIIPDALGDGRDQWLVRNKENPTPTQVWADQCRLEEPTEHVVTGAFIDSLPADTIFRTGLVVDNPDGINMENTGRRLLFVAVTGTVFDWAVYVDYEDEGHSPNDIRFHGQKVRPDNARRCVPCDDEAMTRYRR